MPEHWIVTEQRPDSQLTADSRTIDGYRVTIETAHGDVGSFFVPSSAYTPENVAAIGNELADRLIAVRKL